MKIHEYGLIMINYLSWINGTIHNYWINDNHENGTIHNIELIHQSLN